MTEFNVKFICNDMQEYRTKMPKTSIEKLFEISSLPYPIGIITKCIYIRDYSKAVKCLVRVSDSISRQQLTIGDDLELKTEYLFNLEIKYGTVSKIEGKDRFTYYEGDLERDSTDFIPVSLPDPAHKHYDILLEAFNECKAAVLEQYRKMLAHARKTPTYHEGMQIHINCNIDDIAATLGIILSYEAPSNVPVNRVIQPRMIMTNFDKTIIVETSTKRVEDTQINILSPDYAPSLEIMKYLCITGSRLHMTEDTADIPLVLCNRLWGILRYSGKFREVINGNYTSDKFNVLKDCLSSLGISLTTGINPIETLIDKLTSIIFEPYKELADRYNTMTSTVALERVRKTTLPDSIKHIDLPIQTSLNMCMISLVEGYKRLLASTERPFVKTYMQRLCLGRVGNDIDLVSVMPNERFSVPLLYNNLIQVRTYPPLMRDIEWESFLQGTYKWRDINFIPKKGWDLPMFNLGQKVMRKFMLNPISDEKFRTSILKYYMYGINDGKKWRNFEVVADNEPKSVPRSKTILEMCVGDVFNDTSLLETLVAYASVD